MRPKGCLAAVLLSALSCTQPASASPLTLTYSFQAEVTLVNYSHICHFDNDCEEYEQAGYVTTYQGPSSGSYSGELSLGFDSRRELRSEFPEANWASFQIAGVSHTGGNFWADFDYETKRIDFGMYDFDGVDLFIDPLSQTGEGRFGYEQDQLGFDWVDLDFSIYAVSASVIPPVPVPQAASLLALGIATFAGFRVIPSHRWRKQRTA